MALQVRQRGSGPAEQAIQQPTEQTAQAGDAFQHVGDRVEQLFQQAVVAGHGVQHGDQGLAQGGNLLEQIPALGEPLVTVLDTVAGDDGLLEQLLNPIADVLEGIPGLGGLLGGLLDGLFGWT